MKHLPIRGLTPVLLFALMLSTAPESNAQSKSVARPFNAADLTNWVVKVADKNLWTVGHPVMSSKNSRRLERGPGDGPVAMINLAGEHGGSSDIYSKARFGDCRIELEVMVPRGSNSGIYVMGEYEVQVLDSFGRKKLGMGDMGAIYGAAVVITDRSAASAGEAAKLRR